MFLCAVVDFVGVSFLCRIGEIAPTRIRTLTLIYFLTILRLPFLKRCNLDILSLNPFLFPTFSVHPLFHTIGRIDDNILAIRTQGGALCSTLIWPLV